MDGISKEEIARLRRLDPAGVHAALIASGDLSINTVIPRRIDNLRPAENAIDAVKFAKKCDYNQALEWLHEHFADDHTHERNVGIKQVERELFDSEIVINKLVKQQMDALGCSEARLTLMFKEADEATQKDALLETVTESDFEKMPSDQEVEPEKRKGKFGYLDGKRTQNGEKVEKFFNTKDIQNRVGMLRQRNGEGLNVLMTPMDKHCFYILVDDALDRRGNESESPVKSWIDAGFKPCLALQTSWKSHQIVFRVPKEPFRFKDAVGNDDSCFDRRGLHQYFQSLNRDFGDHRISGLRHGIRLAGYRNVKPKHAREVEGKAWGVEYPFVRIAHAESTFCEKTLNDALKMCSHNVLGNIERTKHALLNYRNSAARPQQAMPPRSISPVSALGKMAAARRDEQEKQTDRQTSRTGAITVSLISAIRAALSFSADAAQTLSDGLSDAAGADVEKRLKQNLSGRQQNHEASDGDKKEKEKSSQPAVTFTIPEPTGPIKEPTFKPEPLPPLPPKPPPLPPKKLAPINNASKQKPPPIRALPPSRPSAAQQPRTALGKMAAAREKAHASVPEQKQPEKKEGRSL